MKYYLLTLILLFFSLTSGIAQENNWNGYQIYSFNIQGREGKIVIPEKANENKNWIWRARFWGHEPQVDLALLKKGFHLVYVDVANLYGNDEAVAIWDSTYYFIASKYKLNPKVVLEGMSRGGLILYNWTARNLEKVACVYADAPVCDIKSWPGGLGTGTGSKEDWKKCLKAYGFDATEAKKFDGNPINHAQKIAQGNIPILHVCGDADIVVPMQENTLLFKENFEKAGGNMKLISKKGIGHHPHSLKQPQPIIDFILKNTR